jgi:D-alanyl-D-alanine carboxypeptidase
MNVERLVQKLQDLVDTTQRRQKHVHHVVLGVYHGPTGFQWTGAAGYADSSRQRDMRPDTPFLIASITKMYTAAAVMLLEERGRLSLDDGILKHLPTDRVQALHRHRGRDYTALLTVRHLLGHTSGLADYFLDRPKQGRSAFERLLTEGDREWQLDDVIRYTRDELPALFAPAVFSTGDGMPSGRARAHYSDTNYKLLGAIIEAVAGRPLHEVFGSYFFEPLSLRHSYLFGQQRPGASPELADVFYHDRPIAIDKVLRSHGPEGGIVSTVDETLRFGRAMLTGSLFAKRETLSRMQRWNRIFFPLQYGFGLMRFKLPWLLSPVGFSPELIGHSGSSGSFLYHCPEIDLYIAGTIDQLMLPRLPFQLLIKTAQLFKGALQPNATPTSVAVPRRGR